MSNNHEHVYAVNGTEDIEKARNHKHVYVVNLPESGTGGEAPVTSVNTKIGDVVLDSNDINLSSTDTTSVNQELQNIQLNKLDALDHTTHNLLNVEPLAPDKFGIFVQNKVGDVIPIELVELSETVIKNEIKVSNSTDQVFTNGVVNYETILFDTTVSNKGTAFSLLNNDINSSVVIENVKAYGRFALVTSLKKTNYPIDIEIIPIINSTFDALNSVVETVVSDGSLSINITGIFDNVNPGDNIGFAIRVRKDNANYILGADETVTIKNVSYARVYEQGAYENVVAIPKGLLEQNYIQLERSSALLVPVNGSPLVVPFNDIIAQKGSLFEWSAGSDTQVNCTRRARIKISVKSHVDIAAGVPASAQVGAIFRILKNGLFTKNHYARGMIPVIADPVNIGLNDIFMEVEENDTITFDIQKIEGTDSNNATVALLTDVNHAGLLVTLEEV